MDNQSIAEEREAIERRKNAAEQSRARREQEFASMVDYEDTAALDNLLEKLRNGDNVGRKSRRTRARASRSSAPLTLSTDHLPESSNGTDTVDIARDMLARLKSDGFEAVTPTSPVPGSVRRSRRARQTNTAERFLEELKESDQEGSPKLADSVSLSSVSSTAFSGAVDLKSDFDHVDEADVTLHPG